MSEPENRYSRLARWVLGHRGLVVVVTLVLTVVAGVIGLPPKVDSNLLNLLPDSDPVVAAVRRINDEEGGLNLLSLTYESDDPVQLEVFLDDLVERFEAMPDVAFAMHELDPDLAKQIGLLQLDPTELDKLADRLTGALALGPAVNPFVLQPLMDMGPLTEKIAKAGDNALFREREAGTGRLIVRPSTSSANPEFAAAFMQRTYAMLDEADAEGKGIHLVWMGGSYRHSVEDVEGIRHDLATTGAGSFAAVLVMMMLAFRSPRAMLIVFPPLIVANVLNLAFARMAVGPLNTFTSFSSAILLGMGIDYAIHLVGRTRELRASGLPKDEAIIVAWGLVGPPVGAAAWTSVAGFLALTYAQFVGFAQLGVLLAMGLVLCFLCMLVLLPILLSVLDNSTRPLLGAAGEAKPGGHNERYHRMPALLGVLTVITVAVGAFVLPRIEYEYDVSALRRDGMSYDELSERERKLAGQSYSPIVVFYDGAADQLEVEQRAMAERIRAGELPHVSAALSITNVLPHDQAERNTQIRRVVELAENPNLRYLPPVLAKQLLPLRGMNVRELTRADLPDALLMLLGANNPSAPRMLVIPKGNMWDVREVQKMSAELDEAMPNRLKTGEYLGVMSMFRMAFEDAPRITLIALLLVSLLTWRDLKRPLPTFAAVGALLGALMWAMVVLWALDVKISMVNITGLPILLGLGVDTVIHLLHRMEEEGPEGGVGRAWRTTGMAAFLSMITTVASFGALGLASSRAVRSLGLLVSIGLLAVFFVGGALLTVAWTAKWHVLGRVGEEDEPRAPKGPLDPSDPPAA